nr:hypothetical protein [uncultured Cohaesibacter sp.]
MMNATASNFMSFLSVSESNRGSIVHLIANTANKDNEKPPELRALAITPKLI